MNPKILLAHPLKSFNPEMEGSLAELLGDCVVDVMESITSVPYSGLAYTKLSPANALHYADLLLAACGYPVRADDGSLVALANDVRTFRERLAEAQTPVGFPTFNAAARAARQLRKRISKDAARYNKAEAERMQSMVERSVQAAAS